MPSSALGRDRLPFRRLALVCAALLSCTTVRTSVSVIGPQVSLDEQGRAEPQLQLWVESDRPLTDAEARRFRGEARAALEQALADRAPPADPDDVIVIRAQGITRTRGHRSDQAAATAGIVVGAVVIVAAVVVAFVVGGKGGGSHGSHHVSVPHHTPGVGHTAGGGRVVRPPPRFAGGPRGPAPRRFPGAVAIPIPRPHAPRPPLGGPHWYAGPAVDVDVDVGVWWLIPLEPEPPPAHVYPSPAGPDEGADEIARQEASPADEPEPAGPPPQAGRLALEPPELIPVEDRGFFAGDRLVLEALVLDRATGQTLWVKRSDTSTDPRDPAAVRAAIDALLGEKGWLPP